MKTGRRGAFVVIEPGRVYELTQIVIGFLGGSITGLLIKSGHGLTVSVSLGLNVSLLVWAFALHEGWHRIGENDGVSI